MADFRNAVPEAQRCVSAPCIARARYFELLSFLLVAIHNFKSGAASEHAAYKPCRQGLLTRRTYGALNDFMAEPTTN